MGNMNWGLSGCGDISVKRVAPAMRDLPGHTIRAVTRKNAGRLEEFARRFEVERTYEDFDRMIEDPDIDAVYLATPVNLHEPQAVAAARAGKHVLCEKPMARSVEECDRMIEACDKAGVLLGVAYYRRFYPAVVSIKKLVSDGVLGTPILGRVLAAEYWSYPEDHPFNWRLTREQGGGGPLMDFGSHRIDIILDILGPVVEVGGFADRLHFDREVEDSALAIMRHESGAHSIVGAYHTIGPASDELEVFGTRGKAVVEVLNRGIVQVSTGDLKETRELPPHENLHLPLIEDFGRAIEDDRAPRVTGEIGRETNRVMAAVYRASTGGMTVRL